MNTCNMSIQASLERIAKAVIASKPKMVKGKATYMGETYTSLDDAWDWFEDDLQIVKDLKQGEFDIINRLIEELECQE